MTLFQILQQLNIPCAYSHFGADNPPEAPPYVVYLGDGQDNFPADNTYYYSKNAYQVEYYFTKKNENLEAEIERLLLDNGYRYEKSEDVFIEEEGVFVIYYNI